MHKLSVVILVKNGLPILEKCLKSVSWADEILVVDSGSTDGSLQECQKYNKSKVLQTSWLGFGKAHHFGVNNAKYDWILNVDQDEVVTPELAQKIKSLLMQKNLNGAFRIKRQTFYISKMIKHCWRRDYPTRFFNRKFDNFVDKIVPHEYIVGSSKKHKIQELFIHYSFDNFYTHIKKINLYTENGAKDLHKKGEKGGLLKALLHGKFMFFKMYILRGGFLDGKIGLILSINSAFHSYMKYIKLWQFNKGIK